MREMGVAREAARAAARVLMEHFRGDLMVRHKDANRTYDLVSEADLASERALVEVLRDSCPEHAILSEESHHAEASSEHLWIVDPLDGTNNYLHGIPHFAVSIAYYRHGEPTCGVIYNPAREDWYESTRGEGAFHNGQPARVAEHTALDKALVGVGFYYDRGAMMEATLAAIRDLFRHHIHGLRRMGTASLDLAQVGTGLFGGFFEYELSAWDFAAGRLFVEEAGGKITDCLGQPLPLARSSLLASNGTLHADLLKIVRQHYESLHSA